MPRLLSRFPDRTQFAPSSRSPRISSTTDDTANGATELSLYGDLKYKPGFKHFDYVHASAHEGCGADAPGGDRHLRQFQVRWSPAMEVATPPPASALSSTGLTTNSWMKSRRAYRTARRKREHFRMIFSSVQPIACAARRSGHDGRPVTPGSKLESSRSTPTKQHSPQLSAILLHMARKAEEERSGQMRGRSPVHFRRAGANARDAAESAASSASYPSTCGLRRTSIRQARQPLATIATTTARDPARQRWPTGSEEFVPGHIPSSTERVNGLLGQSTCR